MPQKKKSQVRESKPLAESPKNWRSDYIKFLDNQKKRQAAYDKAVRSIKPKHYRENKRQGKSVKKEKYNRFGGSFTSDM